MLIFQAVYEYSKKAMNFLLKKEKMSCIMRKDTL